MNRFVKFLAIATFLFSAQAHADSTVPDVPAGQYVLDPAHASLVFGLNHMGFSHYTAQFGQFNATLDFDPAKPSNSKLDAIVAPKSLILPSPPVGFKDELLGEKWLDVAKYPTINFKSTKVEITGTNMAKITGDFTLHGVTKPLVLDATFNGGYKGIPGMDPNARIGFSAHGVIKRSDYGISTGIPQPGSNMGVGDDVDVKIEAEFKGPALAGAAAAPAEKK